MIPNPFAIARLKRGPVEVHPDPVEPDPVRMVEPDVNWPATTKTTEATIPPAPVPDRPCGVCDVPKDVHGVRYAHEVGHHEYMPPGGPSTFERQARSAGADE